MAATIDFNNYYVPGTVLSMSCVMSLNLSNDLVKCAFNRKGNSSSEKLTNLPKTHS